MRKKLRGYWLWFDVVADEDGILLSDVCDLEFEVRDGCWNCYRGGYHGHGVMDTRSRVCEAAENKMKEGADGRNVTVARWIEEKKIPR
jgi:hypothetical protein